MGSRLGHRGTWAPDPARFGDTLLGAITDSVTVQPWTSAGYSFVADMDLFNADDILQQLSCGPNADSSDCFVLSKALEHWGEGAFARLNASFAVAAYQEREDCLILARDSAAPAPCITRNLTGALPLPANTRPCWRCPASPESSTVKPCNISARANHFRPPNR